MERYKKDALRNTGWKSSPTTFKNVGHARRLYKIVKNGERNLLRPRKGQGSEGEDWNATYTCVIPKND